MAIFSTEHSQLVVITRPDFYDGEAGQISALLEADSHFLLHLRKPEASADAYRQVLRALPAAHLDRVCLGDHFELADEFAVGGVHLSGRQKEYNGSRNLRISKSCHSLAELENIGSFAYVFLSPIFNSISKQGYCSAFTPDVLVAASQSGLINKKVFALGGVDAHTIPLLLPYAFGGAAVLGTVWKDFSVQRFKALAALFG